MKILFLCGRETTYPLNHFLIACFRQLGTVDVISETGSGQSIVRRSIQVFFSALPEILANQYDLMFVGFYGQLLMVSAGMIARRPVLFNPFISTYETLVFDRQRFSSHSWPARLAYLLDRAACRRATIILVDTQANLDYFSQTLKIPQENFIKIYIGSNEQVFYPRPQQKTGEDIIILSHGSYLPLHGLDTIIYAAQILQKYPHLRFRMVGRGIDYERITKLAETLRLNNIEFIDSVPPDQLPEMIAQADICLGGHFGKSDKAARVIAGKTFQDIAMGKATIVGDTPANRELLTHNVDAWFCPTGNPNALADGILTLAEDHELRLTIGQNAYRTFLQQASSQVLIPKIKILVDLLVGW